MSDWFTTALAMQREMVRAQQAQIDAARKMLDLGASAVKMQDAGREMLVAQQRAYGAWARLWGVK